MNPLPASFPFSIKGERKATQKKKIFDFKEAKPTWKQEGKKKKKKMALLQRPFSLRQSQTNPRLSIILSPLRFENLGPCNMCSGSSEGSSKDTLFQMHLNNQPTQLSKGFSHNGPERIRPQKQKHPTRTTLPSPFLFFLTL